ncbi:hypothetical protein [Ureibacillus sinduriensis]|uniref:Acyltransferase n=1 Tax=Ureibacillus sinduriensis BLB-1 = JCM 15800 TaxID=1384057 RepID=A0A0A3HSF7_9BACL|nr:hypothetical protein [Ureibacillus sinduriensis]KGR75344.1 hypothetical protein CD33_11505 [Ureibacillus sinduriensis BLB-1 = JCM 15800]
MEKRRFKFVIPSMVIVCVGAIMMLKNYFQEVSTRDGVLLVVIATLFSGFIAYILFPHDDEKKPDPKPVGTKKKDFK